MQPDSSTPTRHEKTSGKRRHHVTQNTGRIEWYTPAPIIQAARETMGGIDLDPATTVAVNEHLVKARHIFTIDDDAISPNTIWPPNCSVWLNPPYRQPDIRLFANRLLAEIEAGTVIQALWLSNNATETQWAQPLLQQNKAICFPRKRISFLDENFKRRNNPTQGQMIIALGPKLDATAFKRAFSHIGAITD